MPLDNRFDSVTHRTIWEKHFCWLPKRCVYSNRLIWLEMAYKGESVFTGPGDPALIQHWAKRNEYIIAMLKGLVPTEPLDTR